MKDYIELTALVKEKLPEKRVRHTLEVEKEARYMARLLCLDKEEALARAALLHDITKYLSVSEHIELVGERLTDDDISSPETLHAISGAEYARSLGEELWQAIECHTTGKADMSVAEKILFLADYTEETRQHEACREERRLLHSALDAALSPTERLRALDDSVCRVLDNTVSYLRGRKVFIHPRTLEALEFYRAEKEQYERK